MLRLLPCICPVMVKFRGYLRRNTWDDHIQYSAYSRTLQSLLYCVCKTLVSPSLTFLPKVGCSLLEQVSHTQITESRPSQYPTQPAHDSGGLRLRLSSLCWLLVAWLVNSGDPLIPPTAFLCVAAMAECSVMPLPIHYNPVVPVATT